MNTFKPGVLPAVIAHRGASGHRPEHTESAYKLAIEQGAWGIEPDLVVSKDGVLVIRHENEISQTTNVADFDEFANRKTSKVVDGAMISGWFTEDFTWAELSRLRCIERLGSLRPQSQKFDSLEPILRLSDLFELVFKSGADALTFVIEIKHAAYFEKLGFDMSEMLLAELERASVAKDSERLVIESFELSVLADLKSAGVTAPFIFLLESEGGPADEFDETGVAARSYAWFRTDEGLREIASLVDGISVAKRDLFVYDSNGAVTGANDLVTRAHALGLAVYTWTLRPENRFLNRPFKQNKSKQNKTKQGGSGLGDWQAELQLIASTGIDGVFADYPGLVKEALELLSAQPFKIKE